MKSKSTDELLAILKKSGSPKEFIDNNHNDLISEALSTHLTALLKEKGKTKAQVIKASELNDIYCYQIFLFCEVTKKEHQNNDHHENASIKYD